MKQILARLDTVAIRDIWAHEAHGFTPWLAEPENIAQLGRALRLEDIELVATEASVGRFSTDIVARAAGGIAVLIENQLRETDHRHLGQLLTYLAGQPDENVVVVWIATKFLEEHRAAIDWLNTNTNDNFEFFGVEIEVLRIGDSPPAARFNVVAKPNDWSRDVRSTARQAMEQSDLRPSFQLRLAYWASFSAFLKDHRSTFKINRPSTANWFTFKIGRAGFWISATITPEKERIGVELYIDNNADKIAYRSLLAQKERIEHDFGEPLEWQELPGKKASRIALFLTGIDPADQNKRIDYHTWMLAKMERFRHVFASRVKALNLVPEADTEGVLADA